MRSSQHTALPKVGPHYMFYELNGLFGSQEARQRWLLKPETQRRPQRRTVPVRKGELLFGQNAEGN